MDCAQPKGSDGTSERCRRCADQFNAYQREYRARHASGVYAPVRSRVPRIVEPPLRHPACVGFTDFLARQRNRIRQNQENALERVVLARNDGLTRSQVLKECQVEHRQ